jgi:5,10-methylene-tetrahydrofolate dehydrogenase/methenyl tetrahydrofolate cyclohydrolase
MAQILDGKLISQRVKDEVAEEVKRFGEKGLRAPCLAGYFW